METDDITFSCVVYFFYIFWSSDSNFSGEPKKLIFTINRNWLTGVMYIIGKYMFLP